MVAIEGSVISAQLGGHARSVFALPRREWTKALRKGMIEVSVISTRH